MLAQLRSATAFEIISEVSLLRSNDYSAAVSRLESHFSIGVVRDLSAIIILL